MPSKLEHLIAVHPRYRTHMAPIQCIQCLKPCRPGWTAKALSMSTMMAQTSRTARAAPPPIFPYHPSRTDAASSENYDTLHIYSGAVVWLHRALPPSPTLLSATWERHAVEGLGPRPETDPDIFGFTRPRPSRPHPGYPGPITILRSRLRPH